LTQFTYGAVGEQIAGCLCDFLLDCVQHDLIPVVKDLGWLVSGDTTVFPAAATMLAARAISKYVTFVDKCLCEFEIMPRLGNLVVQSLRCVRLRASRGSQDASVQYLTGAQK
jgi:hypothetical protein